MLEHSRVSIAQCEFGYGIARIASEIVNVGLVGKFGKQVPNDFQFTEFHSRSQWLLILNVLIQQTRVACEQFFDSLQITNFDGRQQCELNSLLDVDSENLFPFRRKGNRFLLLAIDEPVGLPNRFA